ncbi:MAG: hypothetical protein OHK0012_03100 [Synechococcales cyanobacterium]
MNNPARLVTLPPDIATYLQELQQELEVARGERAVLLQTIDHLNHQVQCLQQQNADLELLHQINAEHGDYMAEQLYRQTQDLTVMLETAVEHGDVVVDDLYQAEQRFRSIVDNTLGGLGQLHPSGGLISANLALTRLLGYSTVNAMVQELHTDPSSIYVQPEHFQTFLHRLHQEQIVVGFETQVYRRDGQIIWVSQSARAVLDRRGQCLHYELIMENISARKNVERLKDEFVSTVSHELRTPLTGIQGALGLVINGVVGEVSPSMHALLTMAFQCGERLTRLINDILDVEKIEAGRMEFEMQHHPLLPIIRLAIDSMATYAQTYQVQISLQTHPPELEDLCVFVDPQRLMQVITNLLSNAVKFSPASATVEVWVQATGQGVQLAIQDHGIGIPESFRPRLFQKFAQADTGTTRQRGGSGLGLSICKAIIEQMGGHIGVESVEGEGTTFFVELPL